MQCVNTFTIITFLANLYRKKNLPTILDVITLLFGALLRPMYPNCNKNDSLSLLIIIFKVPVSTCSLKLVIET